MLNLEQRAHGGASMRETGALIGARVKILTHPPLPIKKRLACVPSRVVDCTCASPAKPDPGGLGSRSERLDPDARVGLAGAMHIYPLPQAMT